jgi:glutamine---fructose-6-phosphate transaminase (isomerizing)
MAIVAEALGPVPWSATDWRALPGTLAAVLGDPESPERAADALGDAASLVCVARGYLNCVALEAALKLREAAGIRAEGWSAADFRHGPQTVASTGLPLLAISAQGPAAADVADLATRTRELGGSVVRLSDDDETAELPFPSGLAEPIAALPAIARAQQLALALGRRRGVDPDRPPGLAKVTPTR